MHQLVLLSILLGTCLADVYMHNPRGSNDRNCEKDVNRQNANRLFDSQNNAAGGYACPYSTAAGGDKTGQGNNMYYHVGSKLKIEWTAQHGCGTGKTKCDIVIQYMCDANLRDGTPTAPNKDDGTTRIPDDIQQSQNVAYGMHESYQSYQQCKQRQRNQGLWIADRNLGNGKGGATRTRQNNNGDRHGFECPEERDYYPYWHPSPWRDIAIFTDDEGARCDRIRKESQNVKEKHSCVAPKTQDEGKLPNNEADCKAKGFNWVSTAAHGIPAPECLRHTQSRENHLGNVASSGNSLPSFASYWWTIPDTVPRGVPCAIRIRYNISGADVPMNFPGTYLDHRNNTNKKLNVTSPITQDPYVYYGESKLLLAVKINSNQYGRTFQDRSYAFKFKAWPTDLKAPELLNLNVRGKRGNIVQTYPSVEYDFVPNEYSLPAGSAVHIQWVGSDYNPRRGPNDAEGGPPSPGENVNQNARADRHNLVECIPGSRVYPLTNTSQMKLFNQNVDTISRLAYLNQKDCLSLEELTKGKKKDELERDPRNCAKINTASNYFDAGPIVLQNVGTFHYMCTRNSNPSNRDQRGKLVVTTAKRSAELTEQEEPVDPLAVPEIAPNNPSITEYENPTTAADQTVVDQLNLKGLPVQMYAENDGAGKGVATWMATVKQARLEIIAAEKEAAAAASADSPTSSPTSSGSGSGSGSGSSSGVSSGAAAGIGIGCAIAGLLIGAAVVVFVKGKNTHGMQPLQH